MEMKRMKSDGKWKEMRLLLFVVFGKIPIGLIISFDDISKSGLMCGENFIRSGLGLGMNYVNINRQRLRC